MRNEILELMLNKCTEVFGTSDLSESTRFKEIGATSYQMVQIATYLENEFDIELPFMEFVRQQNIGEAVDYIFAILEE